MTIPVRLATRILLTTVATMAVASTAKAQGDGWRTIEFETREVTAG